VSHKSLIAAVTGILLVLACVAIGYLFGQAEAPTATEWQAERMRSQSEARDIAAAEAFTDSGPRGRQRGFEAGEERGARVGGRRGARAGNQAVEEVLVTIEEEEFAELVYDPQLPNGDPGYLLPEDERSVACVGVSEVSGECVGD
jgi:hypothetical protein